MNKKISTLLAAFLLAGFSYTVEAGVVKVTNPVNGRTYVVGADNLTTLAGNTVDQLMNNAGTPEFTNNSGASAALTTTDYLWSFLGSESEFNLVFAPNNYLEYEATAARYNTVTSANTRWTYDAATGIISLKSDGTKQITRNGTPATVAVEFAGSGTPLYFYAVTEKVADVALTHLKFNGKWLVAENATDVKLVDDATLEAYKTANPKAAQWKVTSASGKYESVSQTGNYLKVSGGAFALDGIGVVFDENTTEGFFGEVDGSSGAFKHLVQANTGAVDLKATPADTDVKLALERAEVTPSAEAAATLTVGGATYDLAESIANEYYLLTSKSATGKYISQKSNNDLPEVLSATPDKYAYWKVSGNKTNGYIFTNKAGVTLKVGGVSAFKSDNDYNNGFIIFGLNTSSTKQYLDLTSGGALSLHNGSSTDADNVFGLYKLGDLPFSAGELTTAYNTYFDLLLKDTENGTDDLEGNPFADYNLVPMMIEDVKDAVTGAHLYYDLKEATSTETSYLFKRSDGFYIVLDLDKTWSKAGISNHVNQGGYKFDILSAENMNKYINGVAATELQNRNLAYKFQAIHANLLNDIKSISVIDKNNKYNYLVTFNANGKTYLTVNNTLKNGVYAALQKKTLVHGSDKENNPLNDRYVNISFVNHESIKYITENNSRAILNGKVLGMDRPGANPMPMDAAKFLAGKPEGQWFVRMTNIGNKTAEELKNGQELDADNDVAFTFVNRENPNVTYEVARMFALGDNKYAVEYNYGTSFSQYGAGRDTLSITPVDIDMNARQMDGYRDYSDEEILDVEYRLAVASTSDVNYYVTENHAGRHLLGLSKDVEDATNWKLVRMDRARQMDKDGYFKYATDSVYVVNHPQYYKNGKYYASNDTVAMVAYALQNTANGEYMTYESPQKEDILSMVCWPNSENYVKHSTDRVANEGLLNSVFRFVIKEKADGKVNLLGVTGSETGNANYFVNLNNKLYGATTEGNGAVQVEGAYTQINSNDLFDIQKVEAPEYRKKAQGDVIRIFREENDHDVMYENAEFLNLGNISQLTDMTPGLYVDTAYVSRGHNNRYQYLLVVNPKYVPEEPCTIPGHPTIHPDTTYGRFLVNLIDSAVYTNKYGEIHANKFINDKEADETYVKLGFVWGYRTGDNLYLTEGQNFKKVKSVIDLNSRDFNIAKFAFRYVNAASNDENGAFKIQTRYVDYNSAIKVKDQKDRRENNNGYLKTINGVVVVTEGVARGEEFNLAAESSAPVANESIDASAVSVIAKEGAVIVKGAEGKKVTISNVLGQTIANTVISSDNATISAPAGIVVVAVEGEAAVKAIVK